MKKYIVTGGCGFIGSTLVNNLLKDNNTLVIVSAIKTINANLVFDISKKDLKKYDNKSNLEFIISSIAKKCGYFSLDEKYNCNYYKPLISKNLIN